MLRLTMCNCILLSIVTLYNYRILCTRVLEFPTPDGNNYSQTVNPNHQVKGKTPTAHYYLFKSNKHQFISATINCVTVTENPVYNIIIRASYGASHTLKHPKLKTFLSCKFP